VVSYCTTTTLTQRSLEDLTTIVGVVVSMDISFQDAIGTIQSNQAYCGLRSFSLTPSTLIETISGDMLSINPSLPSDAGSWDVTLTVGLVSYPDIPKIQVSFKITVTCQVTTLAWTTNPSSLTTIKVGIDPQPA